MDRIEATDGIISWIEFHRDPTPLVRLRISQHWFIYQATCSYLISFSWAELVESRKKWMHHDDVIKWKHFPRYWPFVRGIHQWPVNSPHKGLWRGALMFSLICAWINGWINNRGAGDLRRYCTHYDVIVMIILWSTTECNGCNRVAPKHWEMFTISIIKSRRSVFTSKHVLTQLEESHL